MAPIISSALPTLSVIMPNYNHAEYLPYSLGAILGQSVRPLEVLIYDDGSTDTSVRIIGELADRDPIIRLVADTRRAGPNVNLNRGFREAKGDFVYAAAADDQVLSEFFERSLRLLAEHPTAGYCLSELALFDSSTGRARFLRAKLTDQPGFLDANAVFRRMRRRRFYPFTTPMLLNREALLESGGFPVPMEWSADLFAAIVVGFRRGACYVPKMLAARRMMPSTYSALGAKDSRAQRAIFQNICDTLLSDEYRDVLDPIRESGALKLFGAAIMPLLLSEARYRKLISPALLLGVATNVPVTLAGLSQPSPSPLRSLDRAVRSALMLDGTIRGRGVPLDE